MFLGVAWAGAAVVPLNIRWSAAENTDAVGDCRPKVLVVDATFAATGRAIAAAIGGLTLVYADDARVAESDGMADYERLVAETPSVADAEARGDELAGVFYTGGTTGRSKGVMLSHRNLMSNALNMLAEGLSNADAVYLHAAPMFHLANAAAMYFHFLGGGSHVVLRTFTPAGLAEAIERRCVTDTLLVPTMIQMLVDDPAAATRDLSSLKRIVYGASPISEAVLDRAMGRFRERVRPGLRHDRAFALRDGAAVERPHRRGPRQRAATGRADVRRHGDVRIVDAEDRPLPRRAVGEIVARGETVMMGYWERPEETRKAIVDGWMHTGDGGYMDKDGYVYVVDRIKDMIVTGGENVYSAEVENCIARHPAVAQCAVIGVPSDEWARRCTRW